MTETDRPLTESSWIQMEQYLPKLDEVQREEDLQSYIQGLALDMAPMELTDGNSEYLCA